MSRNGPGPVGLDTLAATLDTYGGDRTRWPAQLRLALSSLIAGNESAQKMLRDAEAFDRLLDFAPQYDAARLGKLQERISAAAARQPRLVASKPDVHVSRRTSRYRGLVATALAASLMLGIFAGQFKYMDSTAGVLLGDSASSGSTRQLAQTDDVDGLLDEDLL
jgi:hypothetical protein